MKTIHSFSARLTLWILVAVGILYLAGITVAAISSYTMISREATSRVESILDATILDIEKTLQSVEISTMATSGIALDDLQNEEALYELLRKCVSRNPNIVGGAIAFDSQKFDERHYFSPYVCTNPETGKLESKQLGADDYDYFCMDWFQIPYLLGKPVWSEPYYDDGGGKRLMSTYSFPIKDEKGNVIAIFTSDISLEWISKKINDIKPFKRSRTYLVGRSGNFINQGNGLKGETLFSVFGQDPNLYKVAKAMVSGKKGVEKVKTDGYTGFIVYGSLKNGWSTAITCQYEDVLSGARKVSRILILFGLLGIGIIWFICRKVVNNLTSPLTEFSKSAAQIAQGEFNTQLPEIRSEDEIKQLRDAFEHMEKSLTSYMDNLRRTTASQERIESELNIARGIQMGMLPHDFVVDDKVDFHAFLQPAKEIGGDLYDFHRTGDYFYFAIGDVSGKGIPAALFMAITRSAFRFISGLGLEMNEVMSKINNTFVESNRDSMFVTMFIAKINVKTGEFIYCNAGHNPLLLIFPDGTSRFLKAKPNIAIGLFDGFPYEKEKITLPQGTKIVAYTDGVTEAEDRDKKLFGEDRLQKWAESGFNGSAEDACGSLMAAVQEFTDGAEQNDDITIMTIKI